MQATGTIQDAEAEAARIVAEARREADAVVAAARRRADAFADARIRRLRELTDRLVVTAETVEQRFGDATAVKAQLDDLVAALGAAAERAAREHADPDDPAPAPQPSPPDPARRRQVQVLDLAAGAAHPTESA